MFGKIKFIRRLIKIGLIIGVIVSFLTVVGAIFFIDGLDSDDGSRSGSIGSSSNSSSESTDYVQWMIDFSEDNTHGYGWESITQSWSPSTGKDGAHGTNRKGLVGEPDVTCATFVWLGLKHGGFDVPETPYSIGGNLEPSLNDLGFKKVDFSESELVRGDIVECFANGGYHVEVYCRRWKLCRSKSRYGWKAW